MNINKLEDINFVSMVKTLREANAGYISVGIEGYHLIACTEEAFRFMEKAYDEWVDQEEAEGDAIENEPANYKSCNTCVHKKTHDKFTENGNVPMCCVHCKWAEELQDKWRAGEQE